MGSFMIRTDLALEARESVVLQDGNMRGIRVEEEVDKENEIYITKVGLVKADDASIGITVPSDSGIDLSSCYVATATALNNMGLNKIELEEGEYYLIQFDEDNAKVTEIYNTIGYEGNYSLSQFETLEDYKETLERLIALQPEHISSYSLIIEEKTPFYELYGEGKEKENELPDEETDRMMYAYTKERLQKAGFNRYEISNYAKKGFESRHNSSYWTGQEYLGVGLGASSLFTNARYHNETDLTAYMEEIEAGRDVRREIERLVETEQMEEFMILGLRRMCGVSRMEFKNRFGKPMELVYGSALKKLQKQGLITVEDDIVALTELGIDVSNQVFVEFVPEEFVRR